MQPTSPLRRVDDVEAIIALSHDKFHLLPKMDLHFLSNLKFFLSLWCLFELHKRFHFHQQLNLEDNKNQIRLSFLHSYFLIYQEELKH